MSNKKILIRVDADRTIGLGHFSRCLAFSEYIKNQGFKVVFAVKHIPDKVENILQKRNDEYIKIPISTKWSGEAGYIYDNLEEDVSAVVLDIATVYAFTDITGISDFLRILRGKSPTILFDGMLDNALSKKINTPVDMIVAPYFGLGDLIPSEDDTVVNLIGPKYFIFGKEYGSAITQNRGIREYADRVLVTFGGADPCSITLKALDAIAGIVDRKLSVRIVSGPGFDGKLKTLIQNKAGLLKHSCEVIDSPASLVDYMLWCDVAVVGSGLTKYELAVTGTPSIQISFNEEHAHVNKPFASSGAAYHLGINDDVTVEYLRDAVIKLMKDSKRRRKMSEIGRTILDTRGVVRILEAIEKLIHIRKKNNLSICFNGM